MTSITSAEATEDLKDSENLSPHRKGRLLQFLSHSDEKTCLWTPWTARSPVSISKTSSMSSATGKLDYLVVHHMEPDHCANIEEILICHPETTVVGNDKTFCLHPAILSGPRSRGKNACRKRGGCSQTRKARTPLLHGTDGPLAGSHGLLRSLRQSPLFRRMPSGSFGALNGNLFADEIDFDRDWLDDARRYYTNIVGKYGAQVQMALKKLCRRRHPSHLFPMAPSGERHRLSDGQYQHWSTYEPERRAS